MPFWLAHGVLGLHALWVLINVFAPLWAWKRPAWRAIHLSMLTLTVFFALWLGRCPLTDLENVLWRASGQAAYSGSFLAYYLEKIVYWNLPQGWLTLSVGLWFAFWLAIYTRAWIRESREIP